MEIMRERDEVARWGGRRVCFFVGDLENKEIIVTLEIKIITIPFEKKYLFYLLLFVRATRYIFNDSLGMFGLPP